MKMIMMMAIMKTMVIKMKMAIAMAMIMMMMINVNPEVCTICLLAQAGAVGADDLAATVHGPPTTACGRRPRARTRPW